MLANLSDDEESGAILGSSSLRQQPTLLCPLDAHLLPLHIELDQPGSQILFSLIHHLRLGTWLRTTVKPEDSFKFVPQN